MIAWIDVNGNRLWNRYCYCCMWTTKEIDSSKARPVPPFPASKTPIATSSPQWLPSLYTHSVVIVHVVDIELLNSPWRTDIFCHLPLLCQDRVIFSNSSAISLQCAPCADCVPLQYSMLDQGRLLIRSLSIGCVPRLGAKWITVWYEKRVFSSRRRRGKSGQTWKRRSSWISSSRRSMMRGTCDWRNGLFNFYALDILFRNVRCPRFVGTNDGNGTRSIEISNRWCDQRRLLKHWKSNHGISTQVIFLFFFPENHVKEEK